MTNKLVTTLAITENNMERLITIEALEAAAMVVRHHANTQVRLPKVYSYVAENDPSHYTLGDVTNTYAHVD